jgi:hypothetical protein
MATVIGKLATILNNEAESGSVVIALCGYGGQLPRATTQLLARATTLEIDADENGNFSVTLTGNDQIQPAGTYYTVTVKDDNGDVVQVNAYVFLGSNTYNLGDTPPFDPALPLMPLPPLIVNELLLLPASDTMVFDGSSYTTLKTVLHSDVAHPTITGMVPGNLYTFIIVQDEIGFWEFTWPNGVHNQTLIRQGVNAFTIQTFVADYDGSLYAISAGTYS